MPTWNLPRVLCCCVLALALVGTACSSKTTPATVGESTVAAETTAVTSAIETDASDATQTASDPAEGPRDTAATADTSASNALPPSASAEPVVMTQNSVAGVALGTDAESALAALKKVLGTPESDSGWGPQEGPCDGMGSRGRSVSWGPFLAIFATGPTDDFKGTGDHLSAFLLIGDSTTNDPSLDRYVLSDNKKAVGRTLADLQAWNAAAKRMDSEIEGPIWTIGDDVESLSGSMSATSETDTTERTSSVRAGLFCID